MTGRVKEGILAEPPHDTSATFDVYSGTFEDKEPPDEAGA